MKTRNLMAILLPCILLISISQAQEKPVKKTEAFAALEEYFKSQVLRISSQCLDDIKTKEDWLKKREIYKQQILEMLGLYPLPERTPLNPVITGKIEHDEFTVEKLHFQAIPNLYVTANLYIPKKSPLPAPAVLYLCGHAYPLKPDYFHGNKVNYQHHAIWFARNGYVCLVIDTLQLGEIPGLHHGTYRLGMWWWNSRGYTPAGIEAWSASRAVDYLFSRPEVDTNRIAVTGRSGGGSYSWTVMAIDERIKVGAPVAGITDLYNYVVDGTVEGHCDCMFFVNTYRWDYPLLAALAAPRPLLICNTDSDTIFPLDGVERTHAKVRKIYNLLNAQTNIGLVIAPGPHKDIQELQIPVFRWFNKFLKGVDKPVDLMVTNLFKPEELKVFAEIPTNQLNTNIHNLFISVAQEPQIPETYEEWKKLKSDLINQLKTKTFHGWYDGEITSEPTCSTTITTNGITFEVWDFISEPHVNLKFYVLRPAKAEKINEVEIRLLDTNKWSRFSAWISSLSGYTPSPLQKSGSLANETTELRIKPEQISNELSEKNMAIVFFAPRGIGADDWQLEPRKMTHVLRRFMLIGQTLEGMRVWDIKRAVQNVSKIDSFHAAKFNLSAEGTMAVNAVYASLFEPKINGLNLSDIPLSHMSNESPLPPDYLNVLKIMDISVAVALCSENVTINTDIPSEKISQSPFRFASKVAQKFGWQKNLKFK